MRELVDTHLSHLQGSGAAESKHQAKLVQYTQNERPWSREHTSLPFCKSFRKHLFLELCNTDCQTARNSKDAIYSENAPCLYLNTSTPPKF